MNYKLAGGELLEKNQTYFELALKKHNYLSFNRVFEDMRSEVLDCYSIVLGPFPSKPEKFEIKISRLVKAKIEKMVVFDENNLIEGKHLEWK